MLVAVLCVAGCARAVEMVPLNDAAAAASSPKMDMTFYGTEDGPGTVTMPSGEVLNGHYRLAIGGTVATGYATASTPKGSTVATGSAVSSPINNPFRLRAQD